MAWKIGQIVGNEYTIERELGEGGFGITYRAVKKDGQKVVIKTLNDTVQRQPDFAKLQEDFLNEALRLAKCPHPHIARVDRVFQEGQLWCMVMDYIDGGSLADRIIQQGVLPEDEALLYMQQIGEALIVVHQQGLLHRDIKPQNIMLRRGTKEAVLIDFGIAREFVPNLTQTHTQFVTNGYAPIEQYYKREKRGAYTDVYALAATLYSLLTGVVPVGALDREHGVPLELPKRLNPKISDQTNQAILKGMALKPRDRPQSMDDWLRGLGTGKAIKATVKLPVAPKLKPHPLVLFGIGTLIALGIALILRLSPSYPVSVESLMVIPPKFGSANKFSEGLAVVEINNKYGYIDKIGNVVIQPQFDYANDFREGLAAVKVNDKYGFIDKSGNFIISPKFDYIDKFSEGLAVVEINNKYGYIDKNERLVIPIQFGSAREFSEGLAAVSTNNKYGYIDKRGTFIIPPRLDSSYYFSEGLAAVKINNKYGYIDKNEDFIIPPQFDNASRFYKGLAEIEINGKWGYIDKNGKLIIRTQFNYAGEFSSEGLANVTVNGKTGYIDINGDFIIPPQFDYIGYFSEGLAVVRINNKYGYIDKKGSLIIQPQFNYSHRFSEGLAKVSTGKKYGYINRNGNLVIPIELDDGWEGDDNPCNFSEGFAVVRVNGKYGYIRNPLVK